MSEGACTSGLLDDIARPLNSVGPIRWDVSAGREVPSPNTLGHFPNARFVVTTDVFGRRALIAHGKRTRSAQLPAPRDLARLADQRAVCETDLESLVRRFAARDLRQAICVVRYAHVNFALPR